MLLYYKELHVFYYILFLKEDETFRGSVTTISGSTEEFNQAKSSFIQCSISCFVVPGGAEIQRECRDYVSRHGRLQPGQVFVSAPGWLPCEKVIHAVGPSWEGGHEEKELREAVYESLLAAKRWGLSSIALPALSGGNFGYPLDRCTKVIVTTLKEFLETDKQTRLKNVALVDQAGDVVEAFHKNLTIAADVQRRENSASGHSESSRTNLH